MDWVWGVQLQAYTGPNATVEYDGSNWTSGGNLNTARSQLGGAGTQTTGLEIWRFLPMEFCSNATEEYDGSSWTTVNTIFTDSGGMAGWGTQALSEGGSTFMVWNNRFKYYTISYDGTSGVLK